MAEWTVGEWWTRAKELFLPAFLLVNSVAFWLSLLKAWPGGPRDRRLAVLVAVLVTGCIAGNLALIGAFISRG